METMLAAVLHDFNDLRLEHVPRPEPTAPGTVVVRVKSCGICGTDYKAVKGIRTNVTLVFSASQALQAGRIGAAYVSPFVGWREAHGEHGSDLIEEISAIYSRYEFKTEVIVAAVRNGRQIAGAALAGADIVTAGLDVYRQSFEHPHTGVGLDIFRAAWEKVDASS